MNNTMCVVAAHDAQNEGSWVKLRGGQGLDRSDVLLGQPGVTTARRRREQCVDPYVPKPAVCWALVLALKSWCVDATRARNIGSTTVRHQAGSCITMRMTQVSSNGIVAFIWKLCCHWVGRRVSFVSLTWDLALQDDLSHWDGPWHLSSIGSIALLTWIATVLFSTFAFKWKQKYKTKTVAISWDVHNNLTSAYTEGVSAICKYRI